MAFHVSDTFAVSTGTLSEAQKVMEDNVASEAKLPREKTVFYIAAAKMEKRKSQEAAAAKTAAKIAITADILKRPSPKARYVHVKFFLFLPS